MTTRTGKIASLPYAIREELNNRLRNGQRGPDILPFLHLYDPTINPQNLTNWRQGGYLDWLKDQTYLDKIRQRSEATRRELEAGGLDVLDKAIYDLACNLAEADIEPAKAAAAIATLKTAVTSAERVKIASRRADLADQALQIERQKFQIHACEKFLEWYRDQRAQQIAESNLPRAQQIAELRKTFFADVDALEKAGTIQLPTA